ncbi:dihydrolipoamide acetyltransferase family protein [Limimaricola pyoseonensis]|uniref:Dihydrolipoamide acetyltransferase component of pyruvate dehydrogenase complex n=1 Tax=Limimaricola pyoseonensis TaxID=521013 RepID=A0A1G7HHL5_9RHOB|nr:dihydrolipoamide acetyltransferase family protein [Limimaricola pyoseonensis]SDE99888.1 pyruvate dehydrogenase E2 component (dihydrolipoamide acetyltransferase) [Limimaricola pyoseonensis]
MPTEVVLPSLSAGMEDAIIARWLKAEGDDVAPGEVLAEIETDKATMELEAETAGRLGRLLCQSGERAAVGEAIALVLAGDEDPSALDAEAPKPAPEPEADRNEVAASPVSEQPAPSRRKAASPLARRVAAEWGVALDGLPGSGPAGRVVRVDVERARDAAEPADAAAEVDPPAAPKASRVPEARDPAIPAGIGAHDAIPHSGMRRTIARRLHEAKTTIPHFYLEADCDIAALLEMRGRVNEGRDRAERISVNDLVVKAAALALRKVPRANAVWTEDATLQLRSVDISIAVATEDGLVTPILREADRKGLGTISAEVKELAARAREGRLRPEEYQGGGFSISNLGMYGVKSFAAIVNPPQSCILAVGAAETRPVGRDGEIVLAPVMSCTLSVDHRSVDGALGAEWLAAFKAAIQNPMTLLL